MLLLGVLNFFSISFRTVALQNEKPALITMICYSGLVYSFFGDVFIFNETFTWVELAGVILIICLNIAVSVQKFNKKPV